MSREKDHILSALQKHAQEIELKIRQMQADIGKLRDMVALHRSYLAQAAGMLTEEERGPCVMN